MLILLVLLIPFFLGVISLFPRGINKLGVFNAVGYLVLSAGVVCLLVRGASSPVEPGHIFYTDALSAFFILVIALVGFAAALFSIDYIADEVNEGLISEKKARGYYVLFNLFVFSMFFAVTVNNLGLLWVAIEMTTLSSAFLVGFHNDKTSIEAAWKYLIICSAGIVLALFGTILFYYTASVHGGVRSLNWTDLVSAAGRLDKNIVKIAFLFILVGYGTKAGLAPMHTWLPDAHSQAVSPVSALLSGVLLKTAIYAILRFSVIVSGSIGQVYIEKLWIIFGLSSLAVAAGFILIQKHLKRLLAYSSIEHVGIIAMGLGFGGPLGLYGSLLHIFNHAVTKSLMFFGAASVIKKYKSNNFHVIRGVAGRMPWTAFMLLAGALSLTGMPPFSIFFSEFFILMSGFSRGSYAAGILVLFFLAVIFGGLMYPLIRMLFGKSPEAGDKDKEAWSAKIVFLFLFIIICGAGMATPGFLSKMISSAAQVLLPVQN